MTETDSGLAEKLVALAARPAAWWGALILVCGMALAPLLVVDVPPLLDYPNHMARMYLLAFGQADPVLSKMFVPNWSIIPNLALDLLIPPMLTLLKLDVAGRIAIGVAILLPILGVVALSRAAFGARSYWPLMSGVAAHNAALRLGLLNFLISIGVALLAAAIWVRWRDRRPVAAIVATAPMAVILFFCHVMGLAFLMLLLGCRELFAAARGSAGAGGAFIVALLHRGVALALVFVAPLALFARSTVAETSTPELWEGVAAKVYGAFGAFISADVPLDLTAGVACLGLAYVCLRERRAECPGWVALAAIMLALCYLAAPFYFKGSGFFSTRFPIMLGFLLFAGLQPVRFSAPAAVVLFAAFAAVFIARMVVIADVWSDHNADLAQLRSVIAPVEPGSKVLVFCVPEDEARTYWKTAPAGRQIPYMFQTDLHEAALLLTERRAFWPSLFAISGQQPIVLLQPYLGLSTPRVGPPPHSLIARPPNPDAVRLFHIPPDWRSQFDYVLLLDAGGEPDLAGWARDRMDLLKATDAAALFRVRKPTAAPR